MSKEKEKEKDKIIERVQPGDIYNTGPLTKSPDGDVKDKNISLIYDDVKINIFVNAAYIRNYASTAEETINNINHFYNSYKEKCHEKLLFDAAMKIDTKLKEYILKGSVKSEETDMDNVCAIIVKNLDVFFTDDYLTDVADYVEKTMYFDEETQKNALKNYQTSLDPVGVRIVLMISVILKQIWLIQKRTINVTKISRKTIDVKLLSKKVNIKIFEKASERCSFVYCNTQIQNWDGIPYDFYENFIKFFMDRTDKTIADNISFINGKHAILGTTEASIIASTYEALFDIIRRLMLCFGHDPKVLGMDPITYLDKHHKFQLLTAQEDPDRYIYIEDLSLFGFNMNRVVKYLSNSQRDHVNWNGPRKKESVITTIAETSDDEDSVSRRDKLLKKDDVMNPEQKRINEQIKIGLIEELHSKLNSEQRKDIIRAKRLKRNVLNMTLSSMFLDYLDVRMGNPLSYMNINDFGILISSLYHWDILAPYKTIREALMGDKNEIIFADIMKIKEFVDLKFSDSINKDVIVSTLDSILASNYVQTIPGETNDMSLVVEIEIMEMLEFFLKYKEMMRDKYEGI